MKLTPVKVRGRRGARKLALEAITSASNSPSSSRGSKRSTKSNSSTPKKRRKLTPSSAIERLPTELLQEIFLLSENIDFPSCSLVFARCLSNRRVQLELCSKFLYQPHLGLKPGKQISRLLACRFLDWRFFQKYIRFAYGLFAKDVQAGRNQHASHLDIGPDRIIALNFSYWTQPCWLDWTTDPFPLVVVIDVPYIPRKLLSGPWTDDKVALLSVLVYAGAEVNSATSSNGEIAKNGLYQAISAQNVRAVLSLIDNRKARRRGVPQITPLTTEHVRYAVIQCGCNEAIVWHMMHDGHYCVTRDGRWGNLEYYLDFMDTELWSWADYEESRGNPKATFLKKELRHGLKKKEMLLQGQDPSMDEDYRWELPLAASYEDRVELTRALMREIPDVINPFRLDSIHSLQTDPT